MTPRSEKPWPASLRLLMTLMIGGLVLAAFEFRIGRDTSCAGLLGRKEFHEIEAGRQRLHQFGSRRDPRRKRQVAGGGGLHHTRSEGADGDDDGRRLARAHRTLFVGCRDLFLLVR